MSVRYMDGLKVRAHTTGITTVTGARVNVTTHRNGIVEFSLNDGVTDSELLSLSREDALELVAAMMHSINGMERWIN